MRQGFLRRGGRLLLLVLAGLALTGCALVQQLTPGDLLPPESTPAAPAEPALSQEGAVLEHSRWHYDTLTPAGQQLYREIYAILNAHAASGPLTPIDEGQIRQAFLALCADHPELFWCSRYEYSYKTVAGAMTELLFVPTYDLTAAQRQTYQTQLEAARDALLARMTAALPADAQDYHRALYLVEHLANTVEYLPGAPMDQTLISGLVLGQSVCAGYARSLQYMLHTLGLPCTYVSGIAGGETHGWNLAMLDGEWYYMDATWADSDTPGSAPDGTTPDLVYYEYFTMTWQQLLATHTPEVGIWPDSTAQQDLYFTRAGTALTGWDPAAIEALLAQAAADGRPSLCLYFTAQADYQTALAALARGDFYGMLHRTADAVPTLCPDRLSYYHNDDRQVVTLVLDYTGGETG